METSHALTHHRRSRFRPLRSGGRHLEFSCSGWLFFTASASRLFRRRTTPRTTPATPAGFPATEAAVSEFRRLFLVVVASGTLAGLLWFGAQYFAVIPLIETAETYEAGAHDAAHGASHQHDEEGWRPADGWQRNAFTALATVLTGIGFSAILFGMLSLAGRRIDAKRGALWGLAAFACFSLAPSLGLPPQPPGVAVADVFDRQLWWAGTVVATAVGLYLITARSRSWLLKLGGIVCLVLPHAVGAPVAAGETIVPAQLVRQFMIASLAATGMFWLALGVIGGLIEDRYQSVGPRAGRDGHSERLVPPEVLS